MVLVKMPETSLPCIIRVARYAFNASNAIKILHNLLRDSEKVKVLVEAPQGFLQYMQDIVSGLNNCLGALSDRVEYLYRIEPSYGSCDVGYKFAEIAQADVILHLGHDFYPYPTIDVGKSTTAIYVPGEYILSHQEIERIVDTIANKNLKEPIIFTYTYQHRELTRQIAEKLAKKGITAIVTSNPVLGCYATNVARIITDVNAATVIVVAGGSFHVLGVGLTLVNKDVDVYSIDPYSLTLTNAGKLIWTTLKKRYWRIHEAMNSSEFGIIIGVKYGQYRPWVALYLEKLLKKRKLKYRYMYLDRVTKEDLDNLAPSKPDAFIVTSCPRLAIEDLGDYWRPVLTPGEARMLLTGQLDRYLFPW